MVDKFGRPEDNKKMKETLQSAQSVILESEKHIYTLIRNLLDTTAIGLCITDADFKVVWISNAYEQLFNTKREKVLSKDNRKLIKEQFKDIFEDSDALTAAIMSSYNNNTYIENLECHLLPSEGREEKWLFYQSQPISFGLYAGGRIEQYTDVTKCKKIETALQMEMENHQQVIDAAPIMIFCKDREGRTLFTNELAARTFGLTVKEFCRKSCHEILPKNDADKYMADNLEVMNSGKAKIGYIENYKAPSGEQRWAYTNKVPYRDRDGNIIGVLIFVLDITEQKRFEEKLKASQQMMKLVLDTIPVRVFWKDKDSVYIGCNKNFAKDSGLNSPEEIIGKNDYQLAWISEAELYRYDDKMVIKSGKSKVNYEEPLTWFDGTERWVKTSKIPLEDMEGNKIGILGCYEDITEKKQYEEALCLTQFTVDKAADAIFWVRPDATIAYANDAACAALEYSKEELLSLTVHDIDVNHPEEIWSGHWEQIKKSGSIVVESQHRTKSGRVFPVELTINHIEFDNKELHCSFARDISKRKEIEEQIYSSLKEKEVLLQEIHHRVKNNMQIISSLLRLQYIYYKDKTLKDLFTKIESRINAMALIHEKLYQSKRLIKVELKKYIKSLIENLILFNEKRQKIDFIKTDVEDIDFSIDEAIPCGLIINELISNSISHAFPDGTNGEIKLTLSTDKQTNEVIFIIEDTGIGLPEDFDFENVHTLGLQLVRILVQQLRGKIEIYKVNGTKFKITFVRDTLWKQLKF